MFTQRQLVGKRLEGQENTAMGSIHLKKTYDTASREIMMSTLRWVGVLEATVEGATWSGV